MPRPSSMRMVIPSEHKWEPIVLKIFISGSLTFLPFLFLFLARKVSGVSVQGMLLRLSFLKPDTCLRSRLKRSISGETKFSEQKRCKKLSLCASAEFSSAQLQPTRSTLSFFVPSRWQRAASAANSSRFSSICPKRVLGRQPTGNNSRASRP